MSESITFWLFCVLFVGLLGVLVLLGRALAPSKSSPVKESTFECGQAPSGRAHEFMIVGASLYFLYAVIFYSLEASALVLLTSAIVVTSGIEIALFVGVYTAIVVALLAYFMTSLRSAEP